MSILAILAFIAVPSMSDYMDRQRIIRVAEALYSELQLARTEAVTRSGEVYVKFSTDGTTTWSVGVSENTGCNPAQADITQADACYLIVENGDGVTTTADRVRRVISSNDYPGVKMGGIDDNGTDNTTDDDTFIAAVNFAGAETDFDPVRGTAKAGTVAVRFGDPDGDIYEMRVIVNVIGRVKICTPSGALQVPGYSTCI